MRRWASLLAVLGGLAAPAAAAIPEGLHERTVELRDMQLWIYTYRPRCAAPSLLLVFHGSERNARLARDKARPLGDRHCMLIVAPHFDAERFPQWRYHKGGIVEKSMVRGRSGWTGHLAIELVGWVRREEARPMPYTLLGHSAGGQFLSRLAAFVPNEAGRIVLANPGSHVFPSTAIAAPYGFGKVYTEPDGEAALRRYLAQPVTIFLGEDDVAEDRKDSAATMAQGRMRPERGMNVYEAGRQLALQRGWTFNWRLVRVPGVGHNSKGMYASQEASAALAP